MKLNYSLGLQQNRVTFDIALSSCIKKTDSVRVRVRLGLG